MGDRQGENQLHLGAHRQWLLYMNPASVCRSSRILSTATVTGQSLAPANQECSELARLWGASHRRCRWWHNRHSSVYRLLAARFRLSGAWMQFTVVSVKSRRIVLVPYCQLVVIAVEVASMKEI